MSAQSGRKPGIFEFLFNEAREAVQDIRQKLVEEGWFGRVVTAAPVIEVERNFAGTANTDLSQGHVEPASPRRQSFEELWAPREPSPQPDDHEHQRDLDFDR